MSYSPAEVFNIRSIFVGSGYSVALRDDGTAVCWGFTPKYDQTVEYKYNNENYIFSDSKKMYSETFTSTQDITIQFKLVDTSTNNEYLSEKRSYIYANPDDGKDGSIEYDDCITNKTSAIVKLNLPDGTYKSVQLYKRETIYTDGSVLGFGEWAPYSTQNTMTTEESVELYDETAYQYKWVVTNSADIQYEYTSDNIIRCDQTPPSLSITGDSLVKGVLTLTLDISDEATGVEVLTYQLNSSAPVSFGGNEVSMTLDDGSNYVVIKAVDYAGNSITKHLFKTNEYIAPEIFIYGIENGTLYGDEVTFSYYTTHELTDIVISLDDFPLAFIDDEYKLDFSDKAEGVHTLKIIGNDSDANEISKSVSFNIEHSLLSLSILSPQAKTYDTRNISVNYSSSEPLQKITYKLNDGEPIESMSLTNLADSDYTLVLNAETASGKTASSAVSFSVKEAIPTLEIIEPVLNKIYDTKTIDIVFNSNSPVTYSVGDLSGDITSGDSITMPEDGVYELTLTAMHPVTGNIIRKSVSFGIDSQLPVVELFTPRAGVFSYTEIPVEYTSNKILTNIKMNLDGNEVTEIKNLIAGSHIFKFTAEDLSGHTKLKKQLILQLHMLE